RVDAEEGVRLAATSGDLGAVLGGEVVGLPLPDVVPGLAAHVPGRLAADAAAAQREVDLADTEYAVPIATDGGREAQLDRAPRPGLDPGGAPVVQHAEVTASGDDRDRADVEGAPAGVDDV